MSSDVCVKIVSALQELFDNAKVDRGHGIDHSLKVLKHADNALGISKTPKNESCRQAIRYAALLHDADDRKFFPDSEDHQNTRRILQHVLPRNKKTVDLTIKLVDLVSCSHNGNSFDEGGGISLLTSSSDKKGSTPSYMFLLKKNPEESTRWMLIPRLCNRLEAIGEIGVLRTWTYNKHISRPLFLPDTHRVTTESELNNVVTFTINYFIYVQMRYYLK